MNANIENMQHTLNESGMPGHNHDGLILYVSKGIRPGSFLCAVLSNDLSDACARADGYNRRALFEIVSWLYNYSPSPCWGSPEKVEVWIAKGGMEGRG